MPTLFGGDLDGPMQAIGGAVKDLFSDLDFAAGPTPFDAAQSDRRDPFRGLTYGGAGQAFGGLSFGRDIGNDLFGKLSYGQDNPLFGMGNRFRPMEALGQGDQFAAFDRAKMTRDTLHQRQAAEAAAAKQQEQIATIGRTVSQGGSTQVATSADNAKLTGAQINDWIAKTRGNSPLAGMGDYILQVANQYGVSAPLMLGIFLKESELGVTAGGGKILSGITDPGRDQGLGGQRAFQGFGTWQEAIDATAANLATGIYKGKSINEQIGSWYVGPQEYAARGLGATDKAGNGTVGDYVNLVAGVYNALGVPFNAAQPAQYNQPAPGGYQGTGGMASIWGGGNGPITQAYGAVTPGIDQGIYGYGAAYGLPAGHTGDDIGLPRGTQLYIPAGLTGVVETAGGTPYFRDEDYGDHGTPGKGELRIRLSNGDILIYGHTSAISVGVGDQVGPGQAVARSGSANGDHLHLEVRRRNPDGSYSLVDPAVYFGGH